MPAYLSWIIVEIAVAASLFAVILAVSVYRLRRNYRRICDDMEPHLAQVGSAFERLTDASRNLHKEVERLFSDPAGREGLERLETLRAGLDRQRQFIDELKAAPITPAFLLHEAVPALDKGITAYEKNLSLLLRQWDDAMAAVASKARQTAAAQLEESEARLASLRSANEALLKEKAISQAAAESKSPPPQSDPLAGARIVELEAQLQRLQHTLHEARPVPADSESELAEARRKIDELAMEVEISRATTDDISAALIKAKADLETETQAFGEYRRRIESETTKPKA